MADFADLTLGSLAYDPFGTAAPQIDFPPEREAEPAYVPEAPSPEVQAAPARRVRLGTAEDAAALAAERRRVRLIAAVMIPAAAATMVLLVLLLHSYTRLTAVSSEAARLEKRIAQLQEERSRLEIRSESAFNMEEVEQTARSSIGMIKADSDQAIYLHSTSEDLAVILDGERKQPTLLHRIGSLWNRFTAYFRS
ncbi:MAG: septum formation initiator family protein [Oscillospiraceae bacterium]|jgi:cell division protein FtsL|nr:septum formation initiator family protein [Oscillospiraceae bacterium]MBR4691480.1 septum formation initiator family protein [Oscillospiraceae bacterium]